MNWNFLKKDEPKQKRKIVIPEGSRRKLLKAFDELMGTEKEQNHLAMYDFWMLAGEVCPEVKSGNWTAHMKDGVEPYFLEED